MKIVVIGSTGTIGSAVVQALSGRHEVIGVHRKSEPHADIHDARSLARAGSAAVSLVNAGLEGFVRAAALEATRGVRVNVVSPPWVTETLAKLKMDTSIGKPAAEVAKAYVAAVEGKQTGQVIEV